MNILYLKTKVTYSSRKLKLSEDFIGKIAEISAGYLSPKSFDELISLIENEIVSKHFSDSSESNMLRIIMAMYDKISFFNDCLKYPHYVELLTAITGSSNYLTDILVRNPEYFYWIVNPTHLNSILNEEKLNAEIKKLTSAYNSLSGKLSALRLLKRKEILRIGSKDILYKPPVEEITTELSILAAAISRELFSICYSEILNKHQIKITNRSYALIALGKLGGYELNYSSDIDLMIFYDEDEQITPKKTYQEILIEAIYLFIESTVKVTGAGYIYRVDFRLRPDGRNSLLTRTINYYLNYYESRGEDWEKQMLIKACFIGGNKKLYDNFISYLTPFIYPASFLISPTEQITRLKLSIEKKLSGEENIKLSPGGIRDVEFSVQALQLLNGGKNKNLRTPNTLEAIKRLEDAGLLQKSEAEKMRNAYIIFRRIEHFLQLMNDKQTHTIPADGEILEKLAAFLGYSKTSDFKKEINQLRKEISRIYKSIMGNSILNNKKKSLEINFENKSKAEKDILFLREGRGLLARRQFDQRTISAFNKIENQLFAYLRKSSNPDLVLQNFARIMRAENFQSIWYNEFADKKFFDSFLTVCEYSQKAVDLFAEDEDLRENFLTRKVFEKINHNKLQNNSTKEILFSILVQFTLKLITAEKVSDYLSRFFKIKISFITDADKTAEKIKSNFFIAALGSFGSGDLTFTSDLDIIFVAEKISTETDVQKYFQNLFLKFKDDFKPFEIDCRLRPEGKSSWLAWDLENHSNYLNTRARVWELQALCKLSFIHGDKKLFNSFKTIIKKKIISLNSEKLKSEILDMRKKLYPQSLSSITSNINLKKSRGGIIDIDFVIQYLLLNDAEFYKKFAGKNTVKIITKISEEVRLSELKNLVDNFIYLKNLQLSIQNIFNTGNNILPDDSKKMNALSAYLNYSSPHNLSEELREKMKMNRQIFDKFLLEAN